MIVPPRTFLLLLLLVTRSRKMASGTRGILVAGVTNRARTQMAEGILRHMTANTVFIKSGGVHHEATVHPLALKVMRDIGIDISGQSVSSLESVHRQRDTYDVYVSIDCSYERRTTDKTQRPTEPIHRGATYTGSSNMDFHPGDNNERDDDTVSYSSLLFPSTPSHWSVGVDATDVRRRWVLWSPRDPTIFYENSTRKLQDHLYEGEPLFMRLRSTLTRTRMKVSERWEMDEIATRYAVERHNEHEARFVQAREELLRRCAALLSKLEEHYEERLLLNNVVGMVTEVKEKPTAS